MEKKGQYKYILIFILAIALHLSTFSQNRKYFIITGKIVSETEFIEPGEIRIIKKDCPAIYMPIPSHGRFRLELDYNADYKLTFTQVGRIPKTILVNTEIPKEVYLRKTNVPHFLMAVKLLIDNQDVSNIYYAEDQKQQITYSYQNDCFLKVPNIYDVEYVDKVNQQQASAVATPENKSKLKIYQVF